MDCDGCSTGHILIMACYNAGHHISGSPYNLQIRNAVHCMTRRDLLQYDLLHRNTNVQKSGRLATVTISSRICSKLHMQSSPAKRSDLCMGNDKTCAWSG